MCNVLEKALISQRDNLCFICFYIPYFDLEDACINLLKNTKYYKKYKNPKVFANI